MANRLRMVRRTRAPKRETIWVSTLFQAVAAGVTTANIPSPLVAAVDWARGTNFEKGAVLKCIRGWYQVSYLATSTSIAPSWFLSIYKGDEDEDVALHNWTTSASYNSEDILYTDGGHGSFSSLTAAAATPFITQGNIEMARQLNIKTSRKLNADDLIQLAFVSPSAAQDWSISGVFRCLLALP